MTYGLIGEHLPHSFSKTIHGLIGGYGYELKELRRDELASFLRKRDFLGINVTIPFKEAVMPYLDEISERALSVGCVNTVVNRSGKLCGYNTDLDGMIMLVKKIGADPSGKKVLILGTGGTSKTAFAAMRSMGASSVLKVSRSGKDGALTYEEAVTLHSDADIIINTTPCGMFPDTDAQPVRLSEFTGLRAVIDAVYNPLRTRLVLEAEKLGVPAEGGLYMCCCQAVRASEHFMDVVYPEELTERIYGKVLSEKENIVLTGMPGSGKTTVGRILAERTGRDVADTDLLISEKAGMPIRDIFRTRGEAYFRELETQVIRELARKNGLIISTGGGAVLREENVVLLKMNGRIFFLDRDPSELVPTDDRPLADSPEKIRALYSSRIGTYTGTADARVAEESAEKAADQIERNLIKI